MDKITEKKIEKMVSHARRSSLFYQAKYNNGKLRYSDLPVLTKMELKEAEMRGEIGQASENTLISYTSGSTGVPLQVPWKPSEYQMSNFQLWYLRRKWYRIEPRDRYVTFFSYNMKDSRFQNRNYYIENERILYLRRCNYNTRILEEYIQIIKNFSPIWIQIPDSLFWVFFEYLKKTGQRIEGVKYIELNGEYVSKQEFRKIVEICQLENILVGNLYGAVEVNGIALTCPEHEFHVLNNNVYIDSDSECRSQELFVTSLYNTIFPIIKYEIGDCGQIKRDKKCKCGMCADILHLHYGRKNEIVNMDIGEKIDQRVLFDMIMQAEKKFEDIYRYQVEYKDNKILIFIFTSGKKDAEIKRFCDNRLTSYFFREIDVCVVIKSLCEIVSERKPYINEM